MNEAEVPQRNAPQGAESWFYAPRHPMIKTPTPYEIARGSLGEMSTEGVAASVYNGLTFDPLPEDRLDSGTLHFFQDGMLFLPYGPGRSGLIEFFEEGGENIIDLALADVFNGFPVTMVLSHYLKQADERRREQARWDQPGLFWVAYVDLVEAGFGRSRAGPNVVQLPYLAMALEDQAGTERRLSLQLEGETFAQLIFKQRVAGELRYFARQAEADVCGFHQLARTALAALGLEVSEERIDDEAILAAAQRMIAEGGAKQFETLTVDKLVETLKTVVAEGSAQALARYGDQLGREKFRLIEGYFAGNREACRRVPVFAHLFEILEAAISGTKPGDWSPRWNPADFKFNFEPGEYPVAQA